MISYTSDNIALIKSLAELVQETTIKFKDILSDDNSRNFVDVGGLQSTMWQYIEYFNIIEMYTNKGHTYKTVGDIGCGVGIGEFIYNRLYKDTVGADFISYQRDVGYVYKYDHVLREMGIDTIPYTGNFLPEFNQPISMSGPKVDVAIAHRCVFRENYNWEAMRPFFNDNGLLISSLDHRPMGFDIIHYRYKS